MVKSKRGFSALSKTLVFVTVLALCLFGFSVSLAYAEDETPPTTPTKTVEKLTEELQAKNLWKVQYGTTPTADEFLSDVDYVTEENGAYKFHVGTEKDYYVYYRADNTYTVSLDTDAIKNDTTLAPYFDLSEGKTTYANNTASGFSNIFTETVTTATLKLKKDVVTSAEGETVPDTLTLTKEWAIVTPHLSYVNKDGVDNKFTPIKGGKEYTYGEDLTNIEFNIPQFDTNVTVNEGTITAPTSIDLKIVYHKPDNTPTGYLINELEIKDGAIVKKDGSVFDYATALKELINEEYAGAKYQAGFYKFEFTPHFEGTAPTAVEKGGVTYYVTAGSTAMFEIKPYDISELDDKAVVIGDATYNGGSARPSSIKITFGKTELKSGDYAVVYTNNTDATNDAIATVTGIGNFRGKKVCKFSVRSASNSIDTLEIIPWDFGKFESAKNPISISATYAPETAEYTIYKLTPNTESQNEQYIETAVETLTGFTLADGEYTQAVADELKKLPVGEYVLKAKIPAEKTDRLVPNWSEISFDKKTPNYDGGYKFAVSVSTFAVPVIPTDLSYEYAGSARNLSVNGYNSAAMDISVASDKEFELNKDTGVISAVNAGTYKITITIKDTANCSFENSQESVELTWTIAPKVVAAPKADETRFTINGKNQTYNPVGFDSSIMNIEGNVSDQSGAKVVTVSLKDKENYVWDSGDTDDITFAWYVDTADTEFAIAVSVLVCLIAVGIAIAVMQYINHRQRLLVFAEVGGQSAEQSAASEEEQPQAEETQTPDAETEAEESVKPDSAENKAKDNQTTNGGNSDTEETQTPDNADQAEESVQPDIKKGGDDNE